jgi:hypothetical protein
LIPEIKWRSQPRLRALLNLRNSTPQIFLFRVRNIHPLRIEEFKIKLVQHEVFQTLGFEIYEDENTSELTPWTVTPPIRNAMPVVNMYVSATCKNRNEALISGLSTEPFFVNVSSLNEEEKAQGQFFHMVSVRVQLDPMQGKTSYSAGFLMGIHELGFIHPKTLDLEITPQLRTLFGPKADFCFQKTIHNGKQIFEIFTSSANASSKILTFKEHNSPLILKAGAVWSGNKWEAAKSRKEFLTGSVEGGYLPQREKGYIPELDATCTEEEVRLGLRELIPQGGMDAHIQRPPSLARMGKCSAIIFFSSTGEAEEFFRVLDDIPLMIQEFEVKVYRAVENIRLPLRKRTLSQPSANNILPTQWDIRQGEARRQVCNTSAGKDDGWGLGKKQWEGIRPSSSQKQSSEQEHGLSPGGIDLEVERRVMARVENLMAKQWEKIEGLRKKDIETTNTLLKNTQHQMHSLQMERSSFEQRTTLALEVIMAQLGIGQKALQGIRSGEVARNPPFLTVDNEGADVNFLGGNMDEGGNSEGDLEHEARPEKLAKIVQESNMNKVQRRTKDSLEQKKSSDDNSPNDL